MVRVSSSTTGSTSPPVRVVATSPCTASPARSKASHTCRAKSSALPRFVDKLKVIDVLQVAGFGQRGCRRLIANPKIRIGAGPDGLPLVDALAPPQGPRPAHGQNAEPRPQTLRASHRRPAHRGDSDGSRGHVPQRKPPPKLARHFHMIKRVTQIKFEEEQLCSVTKLDAP